MLNDRLSKQIGLAVALASMISVAPGFISESSARVDKAQKRVQSINEFLLQSMMITAQVSQAIQSGSRDTATMSRMLSQSYEIMAKAISSMLLLRHEARLKDPSMDDVIKLMWQVKHPNLAARLAIERGDLKRALEILTKLRTQQHRLMNGVSMLIF